MPQGHWKTTTVTTGLRVSGLTAPWLLDGAMSGQAFRAYVLAPTLQPGDTFVMDNLPANTARSRAPYAFRACPDRC